MLTAPAGMLVLTSGFRSRVTQEHLNAPILRFRDVFTDGNLQFSKDSLELFIVPGQSYALADFTDVLVVGQWLTPISVCFLLTSHRDLVAKKSASWYCFVVEK